MLPHGRFRYRARAQGLLTGGAPGQQARGMWAPYSSLLPLPLLDVNECDDLNGPAALCVHGHCENTEGSYRCHCLPGYVAEAGPPHCTAKE